MLTAIRLFLTLKTADKKNSLAISGFAKVSQITLLPTMIFTIAKVISGLISDSHSDMFQFLRQFMVTNLILIPMLAIIYYGIRLRSWFDLILYILLFVSALIWIEEYQYLQKILI
jgi:hypothetical protein